MTAETFQYIFDVYPERELEVRLNELGISGWELITARWEEYSYGGRTQMQARCILKRRRSPGEALTEDEFEPTLRALRVT